MMKQSILVVDDTADTLEVIQRNLESNNYRVFTSDNAPEALKVLDSFPIDLVITDLKMPGYTGIELIKYIREHYKDIECMMITGYATVKSAVEAMKSGAVEFLSKPFTDEELLSAVHQALERKKYYKICTDSNEVEANQFEKFGLIGESDSMKKVYRAINKVSLTNANVLITGESGTGKELVARAIHYSSSRSTAPFIPVNCGGIPENLLESELFGFVKGAFTGAFETRAGFFQTADGGTIFLDEISETSMAMQVKLLRVLQDKEVCMVGANRAIKVDVRIIAATNKDLANLVKKGSFREDLYFRLNVITIDIPPLRERGDDIILLINNLARKYSKEYGIQMPRFTDKALDLMRRYHWHGNVRELENIIQRVVLMAENETIDAPDLPDIMKFPSIKEVGFNRTLEEVELEYIKNVLKSVDGNRTLAAKILGIDRKTLREKLKLND